MKPYRLRGLLFLILWGATPLLIAATPNTASESVGTFSSTTSAHGESDGSSSPDLSYRIRLAVSGNYASSSPNFYGVGGAVEPTLVINDTFAAGLRMDGVAMLGFGVTTP